jgi:hypothetical protein
MAKSGGTGALTPAKEAKIEAKVERYLKDPALLHEAVANSIKRKRSPRVHKAMNGHLASLKEIVWDKLQSLNAGQRLHKIIYQDLDWCNFKKNRLFVLVVTVAKVVVPLFDKVAGLIANIVLAAQQYLFDRHCKCP